MMVLFLLMGGVLVPMLWVLRLFKRDLEQPQKHQPFQQFLQGKKQHQPPHAHNVPKRHKVQAK